MRPTSSDPSAKRAGMGSVTATSAAPRELEPPALAVSGRVAPQLERADLRQRGLQVDRDLLGPAARPAQHRVERRERAQLVRELHDVARLVDPVRRRRVQRELDGPLEREREGPPAELDRLALLEPARDE